MDFNPNDLKHITETFTIQAPPGDTSSIIKESSSGEEYIMPRIEAIHAGTTKNFNHYLADKLKGDFEKKSGVYSWTHPYNKPVIYNHDTSTDATGRVEKAAYTDYTSTGKPGIVIIPKITDSEAVKAIKDGRLLTVSIGATTDSITCSISGKNILKDGFSGYQKGEYYDGVLCEWIIGDLWFDEVSWVNVPADENAQIVDIQTGLLANNSEESMDKSATRSLQEEFGLPKGSPIFVPELHEETDIKNKTAENVEQEEAVGMDLAEKEKEDLVLDEEELEVSETEVEENPKDEATEEEEETKTEDEAQEEPSAEDETESDEKNPDEETEEAVAETNDSIVVQGLKAQIKALTKELKENYIQNIVQLKNVSESNKESFVTRLEKRSLESLRDTLEDVREELGSLEENLPETKTQRPVPQKIYSPMATKENKEAEKKTLTEDEKIDILSNLFYR